MLKLLVEQMNLHRKIKKIYSRFEIIAILLLFSFNGLAMAQTTGDTSGVFVFVIDTSSSMENKSFLTSLTVANMVEKGISNRLKDGDAIMVWTYGDKIDTTTFDQIIWKSQEARNISNKIFMYLKNLKYSRNKSKSLSLNYLSLFIDTKKGATIYIISDGGKPIDGIPFGAVFMRISQQYYKRWKKEKVPCITAIVLEKGTITDWAIGEATQSGTVKTITMMEKNVKPVTEKQISRKTNENTVVKNIETKEEQKPLAQKTNDVAKIDIKTNVLNKTSEPQILKMNELKTDTKPLTEKKVEGKVLSTNQTPIKAETNIVKNDIIISATNKLSNDIKKVKESNNVSKFNQAITNENVITTNALINPAIIVATNLTENVADTSKKSETNYQSQDLNKIVKIEPKELTNNTQQVSLANNDNLNQTTNRAAVVIGESNDVKKTANLTVTQNIAAFPDGVKKGDYYLLRLAIIFGLTACVLWCFGYSKYRRNHRYSLITKGMDKEKIFKQ
ncbi:MAG TPA: hypothetical protein PLW02_06210 [Verrucomicrobiota bacterium]|nr:hypothetical protein [Verrucomicrobiota bacterium]